MATLQEQLDEIEAKLTLGVTLAQVDGLRTEWDIAALERRAQELRRMLSEQQSASSPYRRVVFRG